MCGVGPLAPPGGPLRLCYLSCLRVTMPGLGFGQTTSLPLLRVSVWFILYAVSDRQSFMLDFSYASLRSPRYNCSICSGGFCITEEGQFQECSALPSYLPASTRVAFPLVCFGGILLSYWKFHHERFIPLVISSMDLWRTNITKKSILAFNRLV